MDNSIRIYNYEQFGQILTLQGNDGKPLFVGKDVAQMLGYSNLQKALRKHVEEEDKTIVAICDTGSNYKTVNVSFTPLVALHQRRYVFRECDETLRRTAARQEGRDRPLNS